MKNVILKKYSIFILLFLLLFFSKLFGQNSNYSYPANYIKVCFVSRVIDGDTFVISDSQHVRMLGVNCPEIARLNKPAETFGYEAKQKIKSLIEHKYVKLTFEGKSFDVFGRLLAYVFLTDKNGKDSLFVQAELLKNGLARISYYNKQKKYYALFYNLRRTAMKNKLGIWGIK